MTMRNIERPEPFRQDFKREYRGRHCAVFERGGEFEIVVLHLEPKYRDHQLNGEWEGSRECHIRPDLLLVYTYEGRDWLILERLGSHAELFGM